MESKIDKTNSSGKLNRTRIILLSAVASVGVFAAATFVANNQPWGYIAPPALSGSNFKNNDVIVFTPWFEVGTFRGDLIAYPVGIDGAVSLLTPAWQASSVLDGQDFDKDRQIFTTDGAGTATAFRWDDISAAQQTAIGDKDTLNFIRGDRKKEGAGYRVRSGVLGDIVHSTPVYVAKPKSGYTFDDYLQFASNNATRDGRIYVGANDGMMHAFDEDDGSEVFAYIPSMVVPNLSALSNSVYAHHYYVDGFLTVEDTQYDSAWHTVLVGGLGAGGKGYYALDISDPDAATEAAAASKLLWEFNSSSTGAENLGYSYSRPSIVRLSDSGRWAAIFGNGYLSANGKASLYVVDIQTGTVIKELVVSDDAGNGLSSPTVIDSDADGIADTAYAGDLNGNVWKFDLDQAGPASWKVDLGGWPLFRTMTGQPITTAPEVGRHPEGTGVMVYVGTGRLLSATDGVDKTAQAVYGLWDKGASVSLANLNRQKLKTVPHADGTFVRVATNNPIDWTTHSGWMTPVEVDSASALDQGERVLQDLLLRDGRISFVTSNPTVGNGTNWFIQLNADTGGAPTKIVVDVTEDTVLNIDDNADGNASGAVEDIPEDRVVGQFQQFGLASRPVVGVLGTSRDAALINHLTAISPNVVYDLGDPGLFGGHFDLDTSSALYDFEAGVTDGHVHEWDDKHDATTINYLDLPDGNGVPLHEINDDENAVDPDDVFILTVGNTDLSPGGVLEINGTSISVVEYAKALKKYVGSNDAKKAFPKYKLNPPTTAEAADGVRQLTSLKMSFDAFAIVSGDLIPTETGCVKGNDPGTLGEYRNGALILQALDASDIDEWVKDNETNEFIAGSTSLNQTHGHATSGLFWESSIFWHWDGGCYGTDGWWEEYRTCIMEAGGACYAVEEEKKKGGKERKKKKKKKKDDDGSGGDGGGDGGGDTSGGPTGSGAEGDPGHNVTNTTIGGSNDTGRLFWRELVPEE